MGSSRSRYFRMPFIFLEMTESDPRLAQAKASHFN